ncbi:MAG: Fe-S cluster assembly protein SufD [Ignavibacteriae bacterium]|nr:Fe-S cluster assembly protein SufD [Ignavibacteriota bacterium]
MIETVERKSKSISTGIDWYLSSFRLFEESLNGKAASQIHSIRKDALARFAALGFPTTKNEEWKYTDISPLTKYHFKPMLKYSLEGLTARDVEQFTFHNLPSFRVVCVNGHFSEQLSTLSGLPHDVRIESLTDMLQSDSDIIREYLGKFVSYENDTFIALNTAFLHDGVFISIPNNTILKIPIHMIFISMESDSEFVSHPRSLIVTGKNAQVSILESYVNLTDRTYFTNTVSEIVLGENAVLEHNRVQLESTRAFHIATIQTQQERNSNFTANSLIFGGSLVRNNLNSVLDGEGAECTLNGLYLGTGSQLIDNHTTIDHAKPHCPSHELYKGILSGKSKGVFNGKIKVRKDAQKTDAKQTNKNLILSDDASIDTKPQLEIFANDVKCTHGATIGQLDEDAIFYLRSRGVSLEKARDILIYAFASDVIDRIKIEALREQLHEIIHDRLERERQ